MSRVPAFTWNVGSLGKWAKWPNLDFEWSQRRSKDCSTLFLPVFMNWMPHTVNLMFRDQNISSGSPIDMNEGRRTWQHLSSPAFDIDRLHPLTTSPIILSLQGELIKNMEESFDQRILPRCNAQEYNDAQQHRVDWVRAQVPIASIQAGMTNKTGAHTLCQPIPYNALQYHAILFVMTNKTLTTVNLVGSEVEYIYSRGWSYKI